MRRDVRDYVAAALDRARPDLERFIAEQLECPAAVPLVFIDPVASIREVRSLKIVPRFPGDYPAVDAVVGMSVWITANTRQCGVDVGMRTFAVDVELRALGTVVGAGYDLAPQHARLT